MPCIGQTAKTLPIMIHEAGQPPTFFFTGNTLTNNAIVPTARLTIIHYLTNRLCISTNKAGREQPTSRAVSVILFPNRRVITICPTSKFVRSAVFSIRHRKKVQRWFLKLASDRLIPFPPDQVPSTSSTRVHCNMRKVMMIWLFGV